MTRHPQPFAARDDQNGIEWSGWRMSETNPFRGWFAVGWELDDWAHQHIRSVRLHRLLLGWLCDWLDRELWK